mmetsp:Transcript_64199/g.170097  ORF Transcript_64199/g.170097 Transcript_64199/m.170097 type:complete len:113 (-) Transcript_64199:112-450(-)
MLGDIDSVWRASSCLALLPRVGLILIFLERSVLWLCSIVRLFIAFHSGLCVVSPPMCQGSMGKLLSAPGCQCCEASWYRYFVDFLLVRCFFVTHCVLFRPGGSMQCRAVRIS